MPRLKRLSGDEVLAILSEHGFKVHSQRGSHVKLRRTTSASRFVPEDELRRNFFTD